MSPQQDEPTLLASPHGCKTILGVPRRVGILLVGVIAVAAVTYAFRNQLRLETLAAREADLRASCAAHPIAALVSAFLIYFTVAAVSLPVAAAMSVLYGWLFGFWRALVLVSFASTAGASHAFLLSRYLLGGLVQARYGQSLTRINESIERDGAAYLFMLRLIPQVPFFLVNLVMGLTKIRLRTFWWVSQLGMLPGTIVFVLAGATAPSLKTVASKGLGSLIDWRLALALTLLGVGPLLIRWTSSQFASLRRSQP